MKSQMPHSKKPQSAEFSAWCKRFEGSFQHGKPAAKALDRLIDRAAAFHKSAMQTHQRGGVVPAFYLDSTPRERVMKSIYQGTLADSVDSNRRKAKKQLLSRIRKVAADAEGLAASMVGDNRKVDTDDGLGRVDLSPLTNALNEVVNLTREALNLIEKRYVHSKVGAIGDTCISYLIGLEKDGVPDREAYSLVKLALLAHGHPEEMLDDLDLGVIRTGTIRKRKKALIDKVLRRANDILYPTLSKK
jgi:hypothetical protein